MYTNNSSYSKNPNVWGPPNWYLLESKATFADTAEKRYNFCQMFRFMTGCLECEACQTNAQKYVASHPIEQNSDSPENLLKYLRDMKQDIKNSKLDMKKETNIDTKVKNNPINTKISSNINQNNQSKFTGFL